MNFRTFKRAKLLGSESPIFFLLCLLVVWLVSSSLLPFFNYYIQSPIDVIRTICDQWDLLIHHAISTFSSAALGFISGTIVAIVFTILVLLWEKSKSFFSLFAIILYSIPLIVAAPITALLFGSNNAGIVLGFIGACLPIFLTGVRMSENIPKSLLDIVVGHGASKLDVFKFLKLPLAIRGWLIGAQTGWIWAVLGALLGDFTGQRWGLGTFLVGSLTGGRPDSIWGIVFFCLSLSSLGLLIIFGVKKILNIDASLDPIDSSILTKRKGSYWESLLLHSLYIILILILWQTASYLLNYAGGIFPGPYELALLVKNILNGNTQFSANFLITNFQSTCYVALIGVVTSLVLAFLVASTKYLVAVLSYPLVLPIIITQITPIVAFVPVIAYYFGRDSLSVIVIVILSTIYPSYIIFLRSFDDTPQNAINIVRGFGGNVFSEFFKVRVPRAAWMAIVAFRLALGRALLGAITAEYLITGNGIGGILGKTRALLDFRVIWLICFLVAVLTLIVDLLIQQLERHLRHRLE